MREHPWTLTLTRSISMDIYDPIGEALGLPPLPPEHYEIDWSRCTPMKRGTLPAWNKGESLTESHKNKISQSLKEHHIKTDVTRKKMSNTRKGRTSPNKGKSCPESAKRMKSEKLLGRKKSNHMRNSLSETRKGSKRVYREDGSFYMVFPKKY